MGMMKHFRRIGRFFGVLAAAVCLGGCGNDSDKPLIMTCEATFPPYEYFRADQVIDGIDPAIGRLLAEAIGRKVDVQDMKFDSVIPGVVSGKADIGASGITITEARKKQILFSDPYVEAAQVVILPKGVKIASFDELKGKRISVQSGTTGDLMVTDTYYSDGKYPERFQSVIEAITAVEYGKSEAAVVDRQPALMTVANLSKVYIHDEPIKLEAYAFAFRKGRLRLSAQMNAVLACLRRHTAKEGTTMLEAISSRYIQAVKDARADGSDRVPDFVDIEDIRRAVLSDEQLKSELARIAEEVPEYVRPTSGADAANRQKAKRKNLTMICEATFPPYEYYCGDHVIDGIDPAMSRLLGEVLGVEVDVQDMKFDSVVPAVSTGKADIGASGITITEERKRQILFSAPYVEAAQVVVLPKKTVLKSFDDLKGKRISVQSGTTGDLLATEHYYTEGGYPERFQSMIEAMVAVDKGKVHAAIVDREPAQMTVANLKNAYIHPEPIQMESYAFAFRQGRLQLSEQMNALLAALRRHKDAKGVNMLKAISERYSAALKMARADGSDKVPESVNIDDIRKAMREDAQLKADLERIEATVPEYVDPKLLAASKDRPLTMICDATYPPYVYYCGDRQVDGIDAEITRMLGKLLGKPVDIQDMKFDSVVPGISTGKADMAASGLTVTEARSRQVLFSNAYVEAAQVVVLPKNKAINSISDLHGRTISVQSGSSGDVWVTDTFYKNGGEPERYPTIIEAIVAVDAGKTDAAIVDIQPAQMTVGNLKNVYIHKDPAVKEYYAFAFQKGRLRLCAQLNALFDALRRHKTEKGATYLDEIITRYSDALLTAREKGGDSVPESVPMDDIRSVIFNDVTLRAELNRIAKEVPEFEGRETIAAAGTDAGGWWATLKDSVYANFVEGDRWRYLRDGFVTTICIAFFAVLLGLAIGFPVAVIRATHKLRGGLFIPDLICRAYLTIIRGTPVVVQLLIIYFVIFGSVNVSKPLIAVVAFGINSGAYVAEILRAGILSIDRGQTEAGRSLGLSYIGTLRHIVLPQAFRNVLPALGNEFIVMLKETSIAGYIALMDLTKAGDIIRSQTYSAFLPLIAVALVYLIVVMILTALLGCLERKLSRHV